MALSSTELDYGPVTVGTTGELYVEVTNISNHAVTVLGVTLADDTGGVFSIGAFAPVVLAPGASAVITVTAAPSATDAFAARLVISVERPDRSIEVDLVGRGSLWLLENGTATADLPDGQPWTPVLEVTDTQAALLFMRNGVQVSDWVPLAGVAKIVVRGSLGNDDITLHLVDPPPIPIAVHGGGGADTLRGPPSDTTWTISGPGSGSVAGVSFAEFENLIGAADNRDEFVFGATGGLTGIVHGGDRGFDTVVLSGGTFNRVVYTATGPDAGSIARDANVLVYAGMEPVFDTSTVADRVFVGTVGADQVHLHRIASGPNTGMLIIESDGTSSFESHTFWEPTNSLTILLGFNAEGSDEHLNIGDLGDFGASLIIHGTIANALDYAACLGSGGVPPATPSCPPQDGPDVVTFTGNIAFDGGRLEVTADTIVVNAGVVLDTRQRDLSGATIGDAGDISFDAETITVHSGAQLLASVPAASAFSGGEVKLIAKNAPPPGAQIISTVSPVLVTNNVATISITGATIEGDAVTISAEGATVTIWDDAGDYWDQIGPQLLGALGQIADLGISSLTPVSGQVKIQWAGATITLAGSTVRSATTVDITAKSQADASFTAIGINTQAGSPAGAAPFILVIGYGEARGTSTIALTGATRIEAGGNVTITSTATTKAEVTTQAAANTRAASRDDVEVAVSIAVGVTTETATIDVGSSVVIIAHGNVQVASEAEAETKLDAGAMVFEDGLGGFSIAIGVDVATVRSRVDGTIEARNPTNTDFTFDAGSAAVVDLAADTITISVAHPATIERGQRLTYRSAGGTAIGGLVDGTEYVVESVVEVAGAPTGFTWYRIRLARGMTIDLDATQTDPTAQHTLDRLALVTVTTAQVTDDGGFVSIANPAGLVSGQIVRYLGPSGSNRFDVASATFDPSPAPGTRITVTSGPAWTSLALYVGQQFQVICATGCTLDGTIFTIASFSPDGRQIITLEDHTLALIALAGFSIRTLPTTPAPIGGLVVGAEYLVDIVGGRVRLIDPAAPGVHIAHTSSGAGIHGFSYVDATDTLTTGTDVDNDLDTIHLPGHGYSTGDLVLYSTDPTLTTSIDLYGFVGATSTNPAPTLIGTVTLPDAPIGGLRNAYGYYVVVVDADTIRLVGTPLAAIYAVPMNLTALGSGTHRLETGGVAGIEITAKLEASNWSSAGAELSDEAQPWTSVGEELLTGDLTQIAAFARNGSGFVNDIRSAIQQKLGATPFFGPAPAPSGGAALDLTGTLALAVTRHTVEAIVGGTARLSTPGDITVSATVEEAVMLASESEATRNASDSADASTGNYTTAPREDIEISIAVAVGLFRSIARALVEPGARVDAGGTLTVGSSVSYPLLLDDVESNFNPALTMKEEGLDGFAFLLDGTLGLSSNLFNVWALALAGDPGSSSADKFVLGLAFGFVLYEIESTARIGAGALINQNPDFWTDTQAVTVEAVTEMATVEAASIAALNLSVPAMLGAAQNIAGQSPLDTLREFVNPFGVSGKTGIGPAILIAIYRGPPDTAGDPLPLTTRAEVGAGARVRTGSDGEGLTVTARQDIFSTAVAFTGAKASDFGLTASIVVAELTTLTEALIRTAAVIVGGPVTVSAEDELDRYTVAGSVVKAEQAGIGISVGINIVTRTVRASIGRVDPSTEPMPAQLTTIDASGAVTVEAESTGNLFSLVMGGAIAMPESKPTAVQRPPTAPPGNTVDLTALFTISVAVNVIDTTTDAHIDATRLVADSASVTARTEPTARVVVVAASFAVSKPANTNATMGSFNLDLAFAGAVGVNVVDGLTTAYVSNSDLVLLDGGLAVRAEDETTIAADAGGFAIVLSLGGRRGSASVAVGVSVGVNDVEADTFADITTSTVRATGDITVDAVSTSTIEAFTIAGSLAAGAGGQGVGSTTLIALAGAGAGSGNSVRNRVRAAIRGSRALSGAGIQAGGGVRVSARDESTITADAGGFAISAVFSASGSFVSVAIGIAAAKNDIANSVTAEIVNSTVLAEGQLPATTIGILVSAASVATIDALTIAGAAAAGAAGSGAGSGNDIANAIVARVDESSRLDAPAGDITVDAQDVSTIVADAGGVGIAIVVNPPDGGTPIGIAIGIGVAINNITNSVEALVIDSTLTGGAISITAGATDDTTIDAFSLGAAAGAHVRNGNGFALNIAAGGAVSLNKIDNLVKAHLLRGVVVARNTLVISATDRSRITADAGGFALALSLGFGDGSSVTVSGGVSWAENTIDNETIARAESTRVTAVGMSVIADASGTIESLSLSAAASVGVTVGSGVTVNAAIAVSGATNKITNSVEASIRTSRLTDPTMSAISVGSGGLVVRALDNATIRSRYGSGTLSVAIGMSQGGAAISVAISVALSTNTIDNAVSAFILDSSVGAAGDVMVEAESTRLLLAEAAAIAISAAVQISDTPVSFAGAGLGITVTNTVTGSTRAYLDDATVRAAGDIEVRATDHSTVDAGIGGGALSLGTVGLSVVIVKQHNTVSNTVEAYIDGGSATSTGGDITVEADSTVDIVKTTNGAVSISISIGGAGSGQTSTATISGSTAANVRDGARLTASGAVTISSTSDLALNVRSFGGSGSLIAGSTISATGTISRWTKAWAADGVAIMAGALTVQAEATRMRSDVDVELGAVGVAGSGVGGTATSTVSGDVESWVGQIRTANPATGPPSATQINVTGLVTISADATRSEAIADTRGGSGSVIISVTLLSAEASVTGSTRAYLGFLGSATAASPATFQAGGLSISAEAGNSTATADLLSVSVGLVGAGTDGNGTTPASATVSGSVAAWAGPSTPTQPVIDRVVLRLGSLGASVTADATSDAAATAKGGSGSVGVAVALLKATATNSLGVTASLSEGIRVVALGNVSIEATTAKSEATATVVVGAGAVLGAGGRAEAIATVSGATTASIGDGAVISVTDGYLRVLASGSAVAVADSLIATGAGVAGGRDARATSSITSATTASIGMASTITTILSAQAPAPGLSSGDVVVRATATAEADAKAQAYGGAVVADGGGSDADLTLTPTVRASLGAATTVTAADDVAVSASFIRQGTAPSVSVLTVDPGTDTFGFGLELREGQIVRYSTGGLTPIGTPTGPLSSTRDLAILVVTGQPDTYRFGGSFDAAQVDPLTDTIRFGAPHLFLTGDVVVLNGPSIATFDPASAVTATHGIRLAAGHGLETGDRIRYRAGPGGIAMIGLLDGALYYVVVDASDARIVYLTSTPGGPLIAVMPFPVAGGTQHRFDPVVAGLSLNTSYVVFVIDDVTIKLRAVGTAYDDLGPATPPELTPADLGADGQFTIVGHGFVDGQPVTYLAPRTYAAFSAQFVNILRFSDSTQVPASGLIYVPSHGLSDGDEVAFRIVSGDGIGGLTDGARYFAMVDASFTGLHHVALTRAYYRGPVDWGTSGGVSLTRTDGVSWSSSGFAVGLAATYSCQSPLPASLSFIVSAITDTTVGGSITSSRMDVTSSASFNCFQAVIRSGVIPLTPVLHPDAPHLDGTYTLRRPGDAPIAGLIDGRTYYVVVDPSDSPADKFRLAETSGGAPLTGLDVDGLRSDAPHRLGTQAIDLGLASGSLWLYLDLTSAGGGILLGPGGANLIDIVGSSGDGTSTTTALGAGGAIGGAGGRPTADATVSPSVTACIGWVSTSGACAGLTASAPVRVTAQGDLLLSADVDVRATLTADIQSGALVVNVGIAQAKGVFSPSARATVAPDSILTIGRDATLSASARGDLEVRAIAKGGAIVANNNAQAAGVMTVNAIVRVGERARLVAGGLISMNADAYPEGLTEAEAFAGAAIGWAGAWANWTNEEAYQPYGLAVTVLSKVEIGADAVVEADELSLVATTSETDLRAHAGAQSFLVLLIGGSVAYAWAEVAGTVDAIVDIGARAVVTGWRGVDLIARQSDQEVQRLAGRLAVGIVPPQHSETAGTLSFVAKVVTAALSHVRAGVRSVATQLEVPIMAPASPYPRLALFVDTTTSVSVTNHEFRIQTQQGYHDKNTSSTPDTARIDWDGDVTIFGGSDGAPRLVIDPTGEVVVANGVLIDGAPAFVGQMVGSAFTVSVTNDGPGNVLMTADNTIANVTTSAGSWPLFIFSDTLASVTIIDHSNADITLGSIDVVAPGLVCVPFLSNPCAFMASPSPTVWLVTRGTATDPQNPGTPYSLQFDLARSAGETFIDIQKLAVGRLIVLGPIHNPTGWTHILHTHGSIEAAATAGWITTNVLHLEAPNGAIGSLANRLNVRLVQSLDLRRPGAGDDRIRTTQLWATARDLVALRLEARDRVPMAHALRPATFVVYVDGVSSAQGSIDLLLNDSIHDIGQELLAEVRVIVHRNAATAPSLAGSENTYDAVHTTHFLPDVGTGHRDPAAYPASTGWTRIDSVYRFERRVVQPVLAPALFPRTALTYHAYAFGGRQPIYVGFSPALAQPGLTAARDIVVKDLGAGSALTVITIVAWTDLADVLDPSLRGVLDVDVAGSVAVVEVAADLRVGAVRSRGSDVTLTAARSILDGDPGDASDDTDPWDVYGRNITLTATTGGIGTPADFLEINLANAVGIGLLNATAELGIYLTETDGDLRLGSVVSDSIDRSLPTDVALTTRSGSILDGVGPTVRATNLIAVNIARLFLGLPLLSLDDFPNINAVRIDLAALGGGIGTDAAALLIDSSVAGPGSGRLFATAHGSINITEVRDELIVLAALSRDGNVQLTVPDSDAGRAPPRLPTLTPLVSDPQLVLTTQPEDLILLARGTALIRQGDPHPVLPHNERTAADHLAGIWARLDINLWVGDDISAPIDTWIVAGRFIRIRGDQAPSGTNADAPGSTMVFAGVIGGLFDHDCQLADAACPNATDLTQIFGHTDDDSVLFHRATLGAKTHVFGSHLVTNGGAADDGVDTFTVFELHDMRVDLGHTLTIDGQAQGDTYLVTTTGSEGDPRR